MILDTNIDWNQPRDLEVPTYCELLNRLPILAKSSSSLSLIFIVAVRETGSINGFLSPWNSIPTMIHIILWRSQACSPKLIASTLPPASDFQHTHQVTAGLHVWCRDYTSHFNSVTSRYFFNVVVQISNDER